MLFYLLKALPWASPLLFPLPWGQFQPLHQFLKDCSFFPPSCTSAEAHSDLSPTISGSVGLSKTTRNGSGTLKQHRAPSPSPRHPAAQPAISGAEGGIDPLTAQEEPAALPRSPGVSLVIAIDSRKDESSGSAGVSLRRINQNQFID